MPFTDFRSNPSWQAAINLGPSLVRLVEELPASEQLGLAWQLQQVMVELPVAIAFDLQEPGRATRVPLALKLAATLDLVDHVYPALDTAATRRAADAVIEQASGGDMVAVGPVPLAPVPGSMPAPEPIDLPGPAVPHRIVVPITPEEADRPAPTVPAPGTPGSVIIAPPPAAPASDQDDHVHPDSGQ